MTKKEKQNEEQTKAKKERITLDDVRKMDIFSEMAFEDPCRRCCCVHLVKAVDMHGKFTPCYCDLHPTETLYPFKPGCKEYEFDKHSGRGPTEKSV